MGIGQELPEDLMIEILVCLPVKSIVRFRCVSKTWCNMLKSPSFINSQLLSQRRRNVLLVGRCLLPFPQNDDILSFHDPNSPELEEVCPNLSIPFFKDINVYYYQPDLGPLNLGPCNGIVCIFRRNFISLCNPALREFKTLPPCPFAQVSDWNCYIMGRGFGNTSINDFKVVLLQRLDLQEYINPHVMVILYSSSTDSWKQIDGGGEINPIQLEYVDPAPYTELFFNGVCHWCAYHRNMKAAIFSFDLSTDVSGWLDYPDISQEQCWRNLMVMNECLAMVGRKFIDKEPIEIWVMKEYGVRESWTKQFAIGPLTDIGYYPFLSWENEWLLLLHHYEVYGKSHNDQLISYSLHTNKIKKYQIYGERKTLTALIYQESLISLEQV